MVFLEGKKKVVSRKVVYGLDVEIKFCWRNSRKTQKREKSKKWNEIGKQDSSDGTFENVF